MILVITSGISFCENIWYPVYHNPINFGAELQMSFNRMTVIPQLHVPIMCNTFFVSNITDKKSFQIQSGLRDGMRT